MSAAAVPTGIALPPHLRLPVGGYVGIAREAERLGYDRLWATEAMSADAFSLLTACAADTDTIRLATGVLPIQTRTPALTAQAAATLQDYSGGRFALGLGVSTPVVVSGWNGVPWEGKLARLREYVQTVRTLTGGDTVERAEGWYPMSGSRLIMHLPRPTPPILLAALGPQMLALAGEVADGVLLNYAGADAVDALVGHVRKAPRTDGVTPTVSAFVRACVVDDGVEAARTSAQREVMAKVVVPAYRRGFESQGWAEACQRALALWEGGDRRGAARSLPTEMTDSIVLFGSAADLRDRFARYRGTDLDEPIVYAVSTKRDADEAFAEFTATMQAFAPAA